MSEHPDSDATARVPPPGPPPAPGSPPGPPPAPGSYRPPPYPAPYGPPAGGPPYPPRAGDPRYPPRAGDPPYPPRAGGPRYAPYPPGYPRGTNGSAVAALVLGILGFLFVPAILALVFGYSARRRIPVTGEGGRGMATAGIVLGWIWIALTVYRVLTYVVGG